MLKSIVNRVFGTRHDRERRRVQPIVDEINREYERLAGVSEEELRAQTAKFRGVLAEKIGVEMAKRGGIGLAPAVMQQIIVLQGGKTK